MPGGSYFSEPGFFPKYIWMNQQEHREFLSYLGKIALAISSLLLAFKQLEIGNLNNYLELAIIMLIGASLIFFFVIKTPRGGSGVGNVWRN